MMYFVNTYESLVLGACQYVRKIFYDKRGSSFQTLDNMPQSTLIAYIVFGTANLICVLL